MRRVAPTLTELETIIKAIKEGFEDTFFKPLKEMADITVKNNEFDSLIMDVESGKGYYENNHLKGKLSAETVRMLESKGQTYNRQEKGYTITDQAIIIVLSRLAYRFLTVKEAVKSFTKASLVIDLGIEKEPVEKVISIIEEKAYENVPDIKIKPDLTEFSDSLYEQLVESSTNYAQDLSYKIGQDMEKANNLKDIQDSLELRTGQMERRARNLVDDNANYYSAQVRRTIYKKNGATHFVWLLSKSKDKRHSHEKVVGNVYSYDSPPILDGKQVLPAEDYGCKCDEKPIYHNEGQ